MSLHVARTVTSSPSDPTTPAYADTLDWLTAYLTIHSLSANSYVYMYLLWAIAAAAFLALCVATWTRVRGGALGARWQRWALRRRTWRKKHALKKAEQDARRKGLPPGSSHRQPVALPSNAQLLSAFVLFAVAFALCFAGPDYINPDLPFLSFSSTNSSTTGTAGAAQRAVSTESLEAYIPHYTISKSFWSSAARTGGIAFALFPLVITFALKAPPFAILAIPGLVGYAHDKTIRLHRYAGRLIWFVTTLHVAFWVVQVCRDRRADTGKLAIAYVWEYPKFRFAWIAYISMTALLVLSLQAVRTRCYSAFYTGHVVLTPVTIVFSALHHPQRGLWIWCAAALSLWVGERIWRLIWLVYVNGVFALGSQAGYPVHASDSKSAPIVHPYEYHSSPNDDAARSTASVSDVASSAHRAMLSASSAATLTDPFSPITNKTRKSVGKSDGSDGEEWEMASMSDPSKRTSTIRLLSPRSQATEVDRMSVVSLDSNYSTASTAEAGLLPYMRSSVASSSSSPPTAFRPASNLHTASAANSLDALNMRLAQADSLNTSRATTPTPVNTPGGPVPSPNELLKLAREESGGTLNSSRRVPLQVDIPDATPIRPANSLQDQSPGAGLGPRSRQSALYKPESNMQKIPKTPSAPVPPYTPPHGFALATLLPGRTIRLRLVTPGYQTWAPGQHFLVTIPSISRFSSHPFSVASVCDEQASVGAVNTQVNGGRELVLLVRAKKGWTKRLWDLVSSLQSSGRTQPTGEKLPANAPLPPPGRGAVLRVLVDGPFGSAARTHWGQYASVLVVAGGSGVAFGMSVLEYLCLCLAGRDGRFLGGHPGGWGVGPRGAWVTQRVRFIWLVREYAHIQWCASALNRCLQIIPTDALEINIFVTNNRITKELGSAPLTPLSAITQNSYGDSPVTITSTSQMLLEPPHPRFATGSDKHGPQKPKKSRPASLALSDDSDTSDVSVDSIMDMYYFGFDDDVEPASPTKAGSRARLAGASSRTETGSGAADSTRDAHARTAEDVLGHETHALDYTNFDGDDDTPLPGENRLSRKLIKEGRLRRARSRRASKAIEAKEALEKAAQRGKALASSSSSSPSPLPQLPAALVPGNGNEDYGKTRKYSVRPSPMLSTEPLINPSGRYSAHSPIGSPMSPFTNSPASASAATLLNNTNNGLAGGNATNSIPGVGVRWAENLVRTENSGNSPHDRESLFTLVDGMGGDARQGGLNLMLDAQEARDLQAVAEWARPGKPKMGKILADEVERAVGRVAVACCGPTSLNALMRKLIAAQIDPSRVARGDLRGSIDFIAEDFEY